MPFPKEVRTLSAEKTENIGRELASEILNDTSLPRFVALFGDLGVGKTAFVRGFTLEIAPNARVKSPTFALVNEYKGERLSVFHFDMYRIEDEDELYSIGFYDYLRKGISVCEWSENIPWAIPDGAFTVTIERVAQDINKRKITITKG